MEKKIRKITASPMQVTCCKCLDKITERNRMEGEYTNRQPNIFTIRDDSFESKESKESKECKANHDSAIHFKSLEGTVCGILEAVENEVV